LPPDGARAAASLPATSRWLVNGEPTEFLAGTRQSLLDALRDYDAAKLARDVGAGLTVGIVALPLAMAFAIASGVKPEQGLYTAIIAGLAVSLLGGSRVQIDSTPYAARWPSMNATVTYRLIH